MAGLLELPKDVLHYILSIVVYDAFLKQYPFEAKRSMRDIIARITDRSGSFYCCYAESKMATMLKGLGLVCKKIRHLLMNVSVVTSLPAHFDFLVINGRWPRQWGFDYKFFRTLSGEK